MKISPSKMKKMFVLATLLFMNNPQTSNAADYPDYVFGVSAKPGFYMLDLVVNNLGAERPYSEILSDVLGATKTIAARQIMGDPEDITRSKVTAEELTKCEIAFATARVYQTDDATTFANIQSYYQTYKDTDPFVRGNAVVNQLLFDSLCLYHNIFPKLMDGSTLSRALFKGRHVVASTQAIADRISGFLDETFDLAVRGTPLCQIMKDCGSDKSTVHNYTKMYHFLLESMRETATKIFEIGIGSTDPQFAYTMGKDGTVGASLRGWRAYFPNAHIYGADIDAAALFQEDRINTYYVDQLKTDVIASMFAQIPVEGFDVIVDDGLHCFEANDIFFKAAIEKLAPRGIYIIEDIAPRGIPLVLKLLEGISYDAALIQLPTTPARFDNNIFVVFKQ
ncbi:MAG: hypothetical protein V4482_06165 [Pseudomonadota bacterium]